MGKVAWIVFGIVFTLAIAGIAIAADSDGAAPSKDNSDNALAAMQSSSPSVQIAQSSGQPGKDFRVNIRGIGTTGTASPLYVVDGVAAEDYMWLNPDDIESIDVLKDAASAAIYGAQAGNGVILITTNAGAAGNAALDNAAADAADASEASVPIAPVLGAIIAFAAAGVIIGMVRLR